MKREVIRSIVSYSLASDSSIEDFKKSMERIDEMLLMEGNVADEARGRLLARFNTALSKFYQIKLEEMGHGDANFYGRTSPNTEHWMSALKNALIGASKCNRGYKRGFVFTKSELEAFFESQKISALMDAAGHLGARINTAEIDKKITTSLVEIYRFSGLSFPHEFSHVDY